MGTSRIAASMKPTTLTCPYCRGPVVIADTAPGHCPKCGRNVAWMTHARDFVVHGVDLWRMARGQRFANACFLLILLVFGIFYLCMRFGLLHEVLGLVLGVTLLTLHVCLAGAFSDVWGAHNQKGGVDAPDFVTALPGINVVAIILANIVAARSFHRGGLPWRLFGWSERRLVDTFARAFCHNCGYNLTGNVSGRCPECGADVPAGFVSKEDVSEDTNT